MKLYLIPLVLLLLPATYALQFLEPAEGQTYNGTSALMFVWDDTNVTFDINGSSQLIEGNNVTVNLTEGTYTATITKDNASVNRTVIISAPAVPENITPQSITVAVDKQQYEVLESARIRINVTKAGQLNLSIQRNNQLVDSYAVNVQSQTDFLYPLTTVGTYSVLVTGQGASATTAFTVVNTTLAASISSSSTATVGRLTTFTSVVSGGTTPYTYFWQFSDNTTSNQANADHVFSAAGNYTATLLVQDSGGRQVSAARNISVTPELYDIEVTVMTPQSKLVKGAIVVLNGVGGGKTDTTNTFGEAAFRNLAAGNYTVNVTYNSSNVSYTNSTTVALTEDDAVTFTLPLPVESTSTNSTSSTTGVPAPATTNVTQAAASAGPSAAELAAQAAAAQAAETARLAAEAEKAAAERLDQHRQVVQAKLKSIQEGVLRSQEKSQALNQLGLTDLYDKAAAAVDSAETEDAMDAALEQVPQEVTILSKDTSVEQYKSEELQDITDQFLADSSITDKKLADQNRYNIDLALQNTTFTLKRTVVRVAIPGSAKPSVYTIFTRSMQSSEGIDFIEYLPAGVSVDDIKSEQEYTAIGETAVRFSVPSYTYSVLGDTGKQRAILAIPQKLVPEPTLLGFVTVKLKPSSFARGPLYLAILGILIAMGVAGNVVARRRNSATEPFTELAELTISLFEQGNHAAAMKYVKEVETIHAALPAKDRENTADILRFIQETSALHTFRASADHIGNLVQLNDVNGLPAAYDKLVQQYEALPPERQKQEQQRFEEAQSLLEGHLSTQEGQQA